MSPVEIEEAVEALVEAPFDRAEFPFQFLLAFDTSDAAIRRLRSGNQNQSDIGGVLNRNNIHIATCNVGAVDGTFAALRESPKTASAKAKFVLATDGEIIQAQNMGNGETLVCAYAELPDHFGFFLQLAGITTVKEIEESSFDIRATGRLNKLYVRLLEDNPEWAKDERRPDMNHFMARIIFCFFAEDTDIFVGEGLFTKTIQQMSASDATDTHKIISELFRAMDTKLADREKQGIPRYANQFPYVNGQLFSGDVEVPHFTKIARSYLIHIGSLDWTKINPDIFGSMIQAVADDEERGSLGMHYTSVPNILKVLNPLFLDDLRAKLDEAGDNGRKLLNLRNRLARIRVFDPACGSGNFLVIAYKEMRAIEFAINERRGERDRRSDIPLTNFRGIELRDFPAEIARLALIIAEYQCDVTYRGQQEALAEFLPLNSENWIVCDNALRVDWIDLMDVRGDGVKLTADDLFHTPLKQSEIDFEHDSGETYICGNPPYLGSTWQSKEQKSDLEAIFGHRTRSWKSLDYVAGWFMKAADFGTKTTTVTAFVSTNSICQGQQVPIIWSLIFGTGHQIAFAHNSFKWANLASHNAGVTVVIVGIAIGPDHTRKLFSFNQKDGVVVSEARNINGYLVAGADIEVQKAKASISGLHPMLRGNMPYDGGNLLMTIDEVSELSLTEDQNRRFIRQIFGSAEFIRGIGRYCIWISDEHLNEALKIPPIAARIENVKTMRLGSRDKSANEMANRAHQMREMNIGSRQTIIMPCVSSENRGFLPAGLIDSRSTVTNLAFALFDAPLWNMAIMVSRLHFVWIATVCGQLETRLRYSNTMGWNTFPIRKLTEQNKADLTSCAENILLAREAHFPKTIADLYDPEKMPEDLRRAHDINDETLERIYIGRRFKNDTERLEKLFELYTEMTTKGKAV